jgi:hypothetical protein
VLYVVVDTNVLGTGRPFSTNAYSRALEESRAERIRLVVPELVIREAVNTWASTIADLDRALSLTHRKLARAGVHPGALPDAVDVGRERRLLSLAVREELERAHAIVAPFPDAPHADVVERALDRRQPFDVGGKEGYRDTLIWETVLELVRDGREVLLVSNDRRAFCAERKQDGLLAPSLVRDVEEAGGASDSVRLAHDLGSALEDLAATDQQVRERAEDLFEDDDFWNDFYKLFWDRLEDIHVDRNELISRGLPPSLLEARITFRDWWESEVEEFRVLHGRAAANSQFMLELKLVEVETLEVRFSSDSYETVMNTIVLGDADLDDDGGYLRGLIQARCAFYVDVATGPAEDHVERLDITSVDVIDVVS